MMPFLGKGALINHKKKPLFHVMVTFDFLTIFFNVTDLPTRRWQLPRVTITIPNQFFTRLHLFTKPAKIVLTFMTEVSF